MPDHQNIKVTLKRDSVCAGDDADAPHERAVEVFPFVDTRSFVEQFSTGYLASVDGVGHSWSVFLNGQHIATMTVHDIEPKVPKLSFEDENSLFFKYHSATY
jgi:hypothetical protein